MERKNYKSVHSTHHHPIEQSSQTHNSMCKNNQYSANTKPSVHEVSLHHRVQTKKKNKEKAPVTLKAKGKDKPLQHSKKHHLSSKSSKKYMKININAKNNKEKAKVEEPPQKMQVPSYRQYCIVEGNFIPLATSNEKRFLNSVMMVQTACTSSEIKTEMLMNRNPKDPISAEKLRVEFKNYSVLVKAAQEDRGVQYSSRSLDSLEKDSQKNINLSQEEESLVETFFKIQFCHLPNKQIFQDLTIDQKRHFRTVFEQICERLRSPRVDPPNVRCSSDKNEIQLLKFLKKETSASEVQKYALLQQNIFMRQAQQKNHQSNPLSQKQIDCTALGIDQICSDILKHIEDCHSKQFVNLMNKMYGWSFKDKFRFISKITKDFEENSLSIVLSEIKKRQIEFQVLGEKIFFDFFEEVFNQKEDQMVQYLFHLSKCIFDSINEILVNYQPYYCTKGDPFPWSTKIFKSITFYSIDIQSIDVLFSQVKEKIFSFTDEYLCGIIVDTYEACFDFETLFTSEMLKQPDPILEHRWHKEQKLLIADMKSEDMSAEMEIADTCVLFQLSELITIQLMDEAGLEIQTLQ